MRCTVDSGLPLLIRGKVMRYDNENHFFPIQDKTRGPCDEDPLTLEQRSQGEISWR